MKARISKKSRDWMLRVRGSSDAVRGAVTAEKLLLWLQFWELISYEWKTTRELADTLDIQSRQLRRLLHRFEAAGLIEWKRGDVKLKGVSGWEHGRVRQKAELI